MPRFNCRPGYRAQAGFSYLWVLLLVAFMGVGLTVAVEIDSTAAQRDREQELLVIGRQFQTALGRYYESGLVGGKKEYPAALDDLLHDSRVPGIRRHLRKVFVDPMTRTAQWGLVTIGGRIVGVHSLSPAIPIKQDGFAPEHSNLRGKQKYSEWVFTYPPDLMVNAEKGTEAGAVPVTGNPPGAPEPIRPHDKDEPK
jgi:hypothetical protein